MSNSSDQTNSNLYPNFNAKSQQPIKRPTPFSIRFTERERAILERETDGGSWAAYIRDKVFDEDFSPRQRGRWDAVREEALAKALGQLGASRLASNMNQIAKAAHLGTLPITPELMEELQGATHDIATMREALITALGIKVQW